MKAAFPRNIFIQAALLMGFWLILSGLWDAFHVTMGILAVAAVMLINYRLRNYHLAREETPAGLRLNIWRFLFFILWLVKEIVMASLQVAFIVLHPRVPADPALLRFKTRLPGTAARVILGNSITLTPGTLTLQIRKEEFLVHALSEVSSGSIVSGVLPWQVARLYAPRWESERQFPADLVYDLTIIKSKKDL